MYAPKGKDAFEVHLILYPHDSLIVTIANQASAQQALSTSCHSIIDYIFPGETHINYNSVFRPECLHYENPAIQVQKFSNGVLQRIFKLKLSLTNLNSRETQYKSLFCIQAALNKSYGELTTLDESQLAPHPGTFLRYYSIESEITVLKASASTSIPRNRNLRIMPVGTCIYLKILNSESIKIHQISWTSKLAFCK